MQGIGEPKDDDPWIADDEAKSIILSALKTRPHSEGDLMKVLNWARGIRIGQTSLDGIISGTFSVEWGGDDVIIGLRENLADKNQH